MKIAVDSALVDAFFVCLELELKHSNAVKLEIMGDLKDEVVGCLKLIGDINKDLDQPTFIRTVTQKYVAAALEYPHFDHRIRVQLMVVLDALVFMELDEERKVA